MCKSSRAYLLWRLPQSPKRTKFVSLARYPWGSDYFSRAVLCLAEYAISEHWRFDFFRLKEYFAFRAVLLICSSRNYIEFSCCFLALRIQASATSSPLFLLWSVEVSSLKPAAEDEASEFLSKIHLGVFKEAPKSPKWKVCDKDFLKFSAYSLFTYREDRETKAGVLYDT